MIRKYVCVSLCAAAVLCTSAVAGPWTQSSGTIPGVLNWSNGGDLAGLYGEPTITTTPTSLTMEFSPNEFIASAANGSSMTTTDTLSVDIEMLDFNVATSVQILEIGSYQVTTGAGGSGSVNVDIVAGVQQGPIDVDFPLPTTPAFPQNAQNGQNISGQWQAGGVFGFTHLPEDMVDFSFSLTNTLTAETSGNAAAEVSKTLSAWQITVEFIPEPSALLLLVAGLGLIRRR